MAGKEGPKTYKQVMMLCPKSGYTIEQVSKHLRRVHKGIERSKIPAKETNHTTNLRDVSIYQPMEPTTLSKNAPTTTQRRVVKGLRSVF